MSALRKGAATHVYLPTGHRLGRYEVLVKLAAGGMAVVYIGRAQGAAGFERLVALKVLHQNLAHEEEFVHMFLDEARLAARIRHPNVVPTIDISDTPETGFFIVMDYVEGDHFGALLSASHKTGASLPVPVALRIVSDALAGLGAAHDLRDEKGVLLKLVHRDVSPHNIMVGSDGVARLTDFGVAKAENRLAHTREGQLKGKLAYMAPEQALRGNCDSRSDLFAMGVILWEALTGRRLFRADNPGATLNKLLHEPIVAPSAIDESLAPLDGVLARALDRDPDKRYQTADEFIEAIEHAASFVGGLASLRDVSTVVRQLTSEKLRKERELLDLAKEALALQLGVVLGREPTDASHVTTGTDVSVADLSLSRSKVSGVFSSSTATGMKVGGLPPAPPPLGAGFVPDKPQRRVGPWLIGVAAVIAVLVGAVVWMRGSQPQVVATPIEMLDVNAPAHTNEPERAPAPTPPPDVPVPVLVAEPASQDVAPSEPVEPSRPIEAAAAKQEPDPPAPRVARPASNAGPRRRPVVTKPKAPSTSASSETKPVKPAPAASDDLDIIVNPYHR